MNALGLQIDHEPGDSYAESNAGGQRTAEEAAHERAEKRMEAIAQFQKAAQAATRGEIAPLVAKLLGLCLQLRALGGSGVETGIPHQLREAADFLEDL